MDDDLLGDYDLLGGDEGDIPEDGQVVDPYYYSDYDYSQLVDEDGVETDATDGFVHHSMPAEGKHATVGAGGRQVGDAAVGEAASPADEEQEQSGGHTVGSNKKGDTAAGRDEL